MHILKLNNPKLLEWLRTELLINWFPRDVAYYNQLPVATYHSLIGLAQDAVNSRSFTRLLATDLKPQLCEFLNTENILVQSGLYLRASRPNGLRRESVGWHREGFYGANEHEHNFWMPVCGVNADNAPRFIPGSDLIPDSDIQLAQGEVDPDIKSARIGLIRKPPIIVGGVDLSKAQPFDVPDGSVAVFPGTLIHGAARNHTDRIRLSVDFRLVAKDKIDPCRLEHYIDL